MLLTLTLAACPAIVPSWPAGARPTAGPSEVAAATESAQAPAIDQKPERDASILPLFSDDTGTLVRLTTSDKVHLAANYFPPRSKNGRAPGVILVHDAGGDRRAVQPLAEYLQKKGFAALLLDLRGHGDSTTDKIDWTKQDERGKETQWAMAGRDLAAAAKFLRTQSGVHSANLTVIGMGAGSILAVRHSLENENVRAVVLLNPPAEQLGFKMGPAVCELGGLPTLVVTPKDCRGAQTKLQKLCHEDNDGLEYVSLQVLKSNRVAMMADKRLSNGIYTWLKGHVMTRR